VNWAILSGETRILEGANKPEPRGGRPNRDGVSQSTISCVVALLWGRLGGDPALQTTVTLAGERAQLEDKLRPKCDYRDFCNRSDS
jgi:hypothetical protein